MALKFRLRGLAETFVENLECPNCGHDGGDGGDEDFSTENTKVTFDGIVVVVTCEICSNVFVPDDQKLGIIDSSKLRDAVEQDSIMTGMPVLEDKEAVKLDLEKQKASEIH